jgi:transposase-like protein
METNAATSGGGGGERRRPEAGERERILAEWATSGRTVEEMAAATGWTTWTLYRWRAEARGVQRPRRRTTERAMVAVPPPAVSGIWVAEIQCDHGWSLRLAGGCCPTWAGQLARELQRC